MLLQGEKGNDGAVGLQGEPGPKVKSNEVGIPVSPFYSVLAYIAVTHAWMICLRFCRQREIVKRRGLGS